MTTPSLSVPPRNRRFTDQFTARAWALVGTLIASFVLWLFSVGWSAKLDTHRFVADSARTETRDSLQTQLLLRIDARVTEIYCADKAPGCR